MKRAYKNARKNRRQRPLVRKTNRPQSSAMEIGTLVMLKEYCANSGRLAIIVEKPDIEFFSECKACKIQYLDERGLKEAPVAALLSNLVEIDSTHGNENG